MLEYQAASFTDARRAMGLMDARGHKYLYDQLTMIIYYWSTKA